MAEDVIEEATDEEGNTYFVNTVTGATGWTRADDGGDRDRERRRASSSRGRASDAVETAIERAGVRRRVRRRRRRESRNGRTG